MPPIRLLVLFSVPVVIALGFTEKVRAQNRSWGVGVGIGYGYGHGPYWGFYPSYYPGFYGNGLSMYGPPVPTYRPIPGVFGGADSRFFDPIPIYPGWMSGAYIPLSQPAALPADVVDAPPKVLAPPATLEKPASLEVEVHVPREDARLFFDGAEARASGVVRRFATPLLGTSADHTYEVRAEWQVDGLTTTHTKRVTGRAGEKVVVEFK